MTAPRTTNPVPTSVGVSTNGLPLYELIEPASSSHVRDLLPVPVPFGSLGHDIMTEGARVAFGTPRSARRGPPGRCDAGRVRDALDRFARSVLEEQLAVLRQRP